jgi:hypothetical protein
MDLQFQVINVDPYNHSAFLLGTNQPIFDPLKDLSTLQTKFALNLFQRVPSYSE